MGMTFDWGPHKGGSGEFVKFEQIGDTVEGDIVAIRTHTFDKDKGEVVLLDLDAGGPDTVTLAIDKVDLRIKVSEIEPQVGDKLGVRFTGTEKTPNGTKKVFAVKHKAGTPPPPASQWDDEGEEPF